MNTQTKLQLSRASLKVLALIFAMFVVFVSLMIFSLTFDMNPFNERTTTLFGMLFGGMIGLAVATLFLNIAANLSAIADAKMSQEKQLAGSSTLKIWGGVVAGCIVLGAVLIMVMARGSDQRTLKFVKTQAEEVLNDQKTLVAKIAGLLEIQDNKKLKQISPLISFLENQRQGLPTLTLIYADTYEGQTVYHRLGSYVDDDKKEFSPSLYKCEKSLDCAYISRFFKGEKTEVLESFDRKSRESVIYFPQEIDNKKFILLFSDRQRYGKYGS